MNNFFDGNETMSKLTSKEIINYKCFKYFLDKLISPISNTSKTSPAIFLAKIISEKWCMLKGVFSIGVALLATIQISTIFGSIILIYLIRKATQAPLNLFVFIV